MPDHKLPYPPRLSLALTPTPMHALERLSHALGVELWVKRDDLTGAALSGNKIRKLEFLLADAKERGCDVVLTCGGEQSNHCRATAIAARTLGMGARLYLRVADPKHPPPIEGNILLDKLVGAEIVWISHDDYRQRKQLMAAGETELAGAGRRPYTIPEGGSNALGAWGYVRAFAEIDAELTKNGADPAETTILYAVGSGGTGAGLILGSLLLERPTRIVGVNVCDDRDYFVQVIGDIIDEAIANYDLTIDFDREKHVEICDGYVGLGYAKSRPDELRRLADLAKTEALILDPVYTGKAFYGMTEELGKNANAFGKRIVFLHTGGIFGLFSKAREFDPLLS